MADWRCDTLGLPTRHETVKAEATNDAMVNDWATSEESMNEWMKRKQRAKQTCSHSLASEQRLRHLINSNRERENKRPRKDLLFFTGEIE